MRQPSMQCVFVCYDLWVLKFVVVVAIERRSADKLNRSIVPMIKLQLQTVGPTWTRQDITAATISRILFCVSHNMRDIYCTQLYWSAADSTLSGRHRRGGGDSPR